MLKEINKLKDFGVFDDFSKKAPLKEFGPKNIIYGWNYSGKTTLSRFFSVLGSRAASSEFATCKFSVVDGDGVAIGDTNRAIWSHPIAVFNSDFIAENLGWDGRPFLPILLLGEDSIAAEKKIERYNDAIERFGALAEQKRAAVRTQNVIVSDAKTAAAKSLRQTIGIDPYTATHLSQDLDALDLNDLVRLNSTDRDEKVQLARTAEADKLPPVPEISLGKTLTLTTRQSQAEALVAEVPNFSETISYLNEHVDVAKWVEQGMPLHVDKSDCEFCGNHMPTARMDELRAHFSKDFTNHRARLVAASDLLDAAKLTDVGVVDVLLDPKFRIDLSTLVKDVNDAIKAYNDALAVIRAGLDAKAASAYTVGKIDTIPLNLETHINLAIEALNAHIRANNALNDDFPNRKKEAIRALRRDSAIDFRMVNDLAGKAVLGMKWEAQAIRRESLVQRLKTEILKLKAIINQAQKGREKINQRIVGMLGNDAIEISVVDVEGEERFQLTRHGKIARNLSDGERTAVAFSFFLTKLGELGDLSKVIVYIDDPISSLDSNHIFQIYAIIQATFFKQQAPNTPWMTTCRQLFVSTHNFDFFLLLKKLPGKGHDFTRYFFVKRLTPISSTLVNLPDAIDKHTSEYHYLFSVLYQFHVSEDKHDIEVLLALPNAVRRFLELYTYAKLPMSGSTVDTRAAQLFGIEEGAKIVKLLHYFSHLESVDRLAANPDVISDITAVVDDVMAHLKADNGHYDALAASLPYGLPTTGSDSLLVFIPLATLTPAL